MNQNVQYQRRVDQFDSFYNDVIGALVEFIGDMGISPAHEVLNNAPKFVSSLSDALSRAVVEGEEDRVWLISRVGYFVGEYFSQKFRGGWRVCPDVDSAMYARYVVCDFELDEWRGRMIDPFEVSRHFVDRMGDVRFEDFLSSIK